MPMIESSTEVEDIDTGVETEEERLARLELYALLDASFEQLEEGKFEPMDGVIESIRRELNL